MGLFNSVRSFAPRHLDKHEIPLRPPGRSSGTCPGETARDGDGPGSRSSHCSSIREGLRDEHLSSSVARGSLRRSIDLPRRKARPSFDVPAGAAGPRRKSIDDSAASPRRKEMHLPPLQTRGRVNESTLMNPYRSAPHFMSINGATTVPQRRSLEELSSSGLRLPGESRSAASFSHSGQRPSHEQLRLRSHWSSHQELLQKGPKQKGDDVVAVSQQSVSMDSLAAAAPRALPSRKSIDLGQTQRQYGDRIPEPPPSKFSLNRASVSDLPSPRSVRVPRRQISFKDVDGARDDSESMGDNALANGSLHSLGSQDLISESSSISPRRGGDSEWDDKTPPRPVKAVTFDPRQNAQDFEDAMAALFNLTPREGSEKFEAEVTRLQAKEDMDEELFRRQQDEEASKAETHQPSAPDMLVSVSEVSMFAAKMTKLKLEKRRAHAEQQKASSDASRRRRQQKQRKSLEMDQAGVKAAKAHVTFERQLEAVFVSFALCGEWEPERMMVQEDPVRGMGILKFIALCTQAGILNDITITARSVRETFSCHARDATSLMGFHDFIFALLELTKFNGWTEDRMLQSVAKINKQGHIYIHADSKMATSMGAMTSKARR